MNLRRGALAPWKVLLVLGAVLVLAAAFTGSGGSVIPGTPHTSSPCPPDDDGREYCVVLTTFDDVQAVGAQKVTVHLQNWDNNTLTNPVIKLTWVDTDLTVTWAAPKPSNCSGPDTEPGPITCTIANVPGNGSAAGTTFKESDKVTLYFESTNAGADPDVAWSAEGRVNEGPSGQPNISIRNVGPVSTEFGTPGDDDFALSFALPGKNVSLGTLGNGNASLKYKVAGTEAYDTTLFSAESTDFCFGTLDCYPLELTSSVPGQTTGLLIWQFDVIDPGFSKSQARVIHRYDPITITANAGANTFNADLRGIDGVHLSGGGLTEKDYYVRNANASTFQVSETKNGPIVDVPGNTGTVTGIQAIKIRLIGDANAEKDEDCMKAVTDPANAGPVSTPSMHAEKIVNNDDDLRFWVCDSGNGNIGPWG